MKLRKVDDKTNDEAADAEQEKMNDNDDDGDETTANVVVTDDSAFHAQLNKLSLSTDAAAASVTPLDERLLKRLAHSTKLLAKYVAMTEGACQHLFAHLDDIAALLKEDKSLHLIDTNISHVLDCLDKAVASSTSSASALICHKLTEAHLALLTRCMLVKSSTPKSQHMHAACLRLLAACVRTSTRLAEHVAVEYEHFGVHKNWLERCLLQKQSDVRHAAIELLVAFLSHLKSETTTTAEEQATTADEDENETLTAGYVAHVKRIFIPSAASAASSVVKSASSAASSSSLVYCLFVHVGSDSRASIERLLGHLLSAIVQNTRRFSKSDKVRLFNERTLANLIKLFEWRCRPTAAAAAAGPDDMDETMAVRGMAAQFLQVLFASTRYGISFYDRTLNVDQSPHNANHLIFDALIGLPRAHHLDAKKPDFARESLHVDTLN